MQVTGTAELGSYPAGPQRHTIRPARTPTPSPCNLYDDHVQEEPSVKPQNQELSHDQHRFLDSLSEVIRVQGPQSATVTEVVRVARASRRTFYASFDNLEDCFLQLLRRESTRTLGAVQKAIDPRARWQEQVDRALTAWGDAVSVSPEIRPSPLKGDAGRRLQKDILEDYVQLLVSMSRNTGMVCGGVSPLEEHEAIMLMGGIRELYWYALEQDMPMETVIRSARRFVTAALSPGERGS